MRPEQNCLSWWFPRIAKAGLPVPDTQIVNMSQDACDHVWTCFDGDEPDGLKRGAFESFLRDLASAALMIGGTPFFLRTGQTSAKHDWKDSCYVENPGKLSNHVLKIAEFSVLADMMGLPFDVWAVRKMLPVKTPAFHAFYGDMPIVKEWRVFAEDGEILCHHPYWPEGAFEGHTQADDWKDKLKELYREPCPEEVFDIARRASEALAGEAWSIDILDTEAGWYLTDCALSSWSWHEEGCQAVKT